MQNAIARRSFLPRDHVAHRIVAHMAHVDAARWVREHLKHIVFFFGSIALCKKDARFFPGFLPFSFGCGGFVARHSGLGVIEKGLWPLSI